MHAADEAEVEAIVLAIQAHLRSHPMAADAVQGVAAWWLGPAHAQASLQQVERALNRLVDRGLMCRRPLTDESFLYAQASPTRQ